MIYNTFSVTGTRIPFSLVSSWAWTIEHLHEIRKCEVTEFTLKLTHNLSLESSLFKTYNYCQVVPLLAVLQPVSPLRPGDIASLVLSLVAAEIPVPLLGSALALASITPPTMETPPSNSPHISPLWGCHLFPARVMVDGPRLQEGQGPLLWNLVGGIWNGGGTAFCEQGCWSIKMSNKD